MELHCGSSGSRSAMRFNARLLKITERFSAIQCLGMGQLQLVVALSTKSISIF